MTNNLMLKGFGGGAWIYNSSSEQYELTINDEIVAIIDSNGNLKIKGRVLKIE